jgi:uncharacterized protein
MSDLMREATLQERINPSRYVTEEAGLPTISDILSELAKPGRDPRETFKPFSFAPGIETMEDLSPGMKLPGIVTNVTAFGAFVDIGVHRDGLVHVSELSDRYVKDPRNVVHVHQQVMVTVLDVDLERKRISLSMKTTPEAPGEHSKKGTRPSSKGSRHAKSRSKDTGAFNNPFAEALKDL